jgi:hypothetical protein
VADEYLYFIDAHRICFFTVKLNKPIKIMEHLFELPVSYKGQDLTFNGRLVTFGYIYKFYLMIDGHEYIFERDDEHNYRMLTADNNSVPHLDVGLIEAIIFVLQNL